jgi:hypothetical protein
MECKLIAGQKVGCIAKPQELELAPEFVACGCTPAPEFRGVYEVEQVTLGKAVPEVFLVESPARRPCRRFPGRWCRASFEHHMFVPLEDMEIALLRKIADDTPPLPHGDVPAAPRQRQLEDA